MSYNDHHYTFTLSSLVLGEATSAFTPKGSLSVDALAIGTFVRHGTLIYVCVMRKREEQREKLNPLNSQHPVAGSDLLSHVTLVSL